MTKLYLVRHGETMDNAAQIMQGQTPGRLNDVGILQAEEVARKMANDHIDVFVSSDLYRSMQTCAIIARPHLEAEMHLKVFQKTPRCASGALVDHRAAFHLIGHWRVAISGICDVQVGFLGEVPAFLRTCRMAIGCGDGHADRSGTCFHVSSGPKRHAQRDGAEAQSGRQIEI